MPLVEALKIVITADSAKAEENLKKLAKATKDLGALELAARKLEPASKNSAAGFAAFQQASANVARARDEVARLTAATTAGVSPASTLKSAFASGLGIGTGIGAITQGVQIVERLGAALVDASKLAEQDARSQFTLGQAIRNNTDEGIRGSAAAESYVQSLQKQAAIADDQLRPALATLVRSTQDVAKAQDLLSLSADVAAGTGTDLGATADALAKAYNGNTRSLKLLAPEVSKLVKDGASATEIFAKLSSVYAGSAKGLADVSPWQRLNVQVEEAKESIGKALLPAVSDMAQAFNDAEPAITFAGSALESFLETARSVVAPVQTVASVLGQLVDQIPGAGLFDGILGGGGSDDFVHRFVAGKEAALELGDAFRSGKISAQQLLPAIGALPPATQALINKFLGVKPAADNAADGIDDLATRTKAAQAALSGISDNLFGGARAQDAFNKALQDPATGSASNQAKQYASALRRVEDSTRSLNDANDALNETLIQRFLTGLGATSDEITSAQIAERDSTRSLADAKLKLIDAQQALNRLQNGGAAASRLEAQAAFLDAQKALTEAQGSGDPSALLKARAGLLKAQQGLSDTSAAKQASDIARAQSAVEAASDNVTQSAIDQRKAQRDLNDTLTRGKEGSKELADANKQVEEAQRRVEDSTRNLDDAQDGVQEALKGTAGAAKSAAEKFDDALKASDAWIQWLATHNATPAEFAAAIEAIKTGLGGVATQAGKTSELDAYLQKVRDLSGLFLGLSSAQLPSLPNSSANAAENSLNRTAASKQAIQVVISGKTLLDIMLDENSSAGSPIVTRTGR